MSMIGNETNVIVKYHGIEQISPFPRNDLSMNKEFRRDEPSTESRTGAAERNLAPSINTQHDK